jgi:hypothetical protein
MPIADHGECRKVALYAQCHYAECRGAIMAASWANVLKLFTAVIY